MSSDETYLGSSLDGWPATDLLEGQRTTEEGWLPVDALPETTDPTPFERLLARIRVSLLAALRARLER
ncbi:MAG: hypothetical protein ABEJ89_08270 [Haloarculaceae archaeon]